MNFYTFCLLSELNLPQAIKGKDMVLRVFKNKTDTKKAPKTNIPDLYDFGTTPPDGYEDIGDIVFKPLSDTRNGIKIYSALLFRPSKSQNSADKIELFHLARDRHEKRVDKKGEPLPEIHDARYKKDFFNAAADKTVETLIKLETDTIFYINSKSPFNSTVINAAKRLKPSINITNEIDHVILKHPYSEIITIIKNNSNRIKSLVQTRQDDKYGTRASIIVNAYMRVLNTLDTGGSYNIGELTVTKDSPVSIELTADCIVREWSNAVKDITKTKTIADSDYKADKRRIIEHLLPYEHYNFANIRDKINKAKIITVLDDNISSGKTFDEVNRKLKQYLQEPNVIINWVVGIKLPDIK